MTHTPGPWYHSFDQRGYDVRTSPEFCKGTLIAAVGGGVDRPANARLIAAAPELLGALRWAMAHVENVFALAGPHDRELPELQAARAAIAKAEGRG